MSTIRPTNYGPVQTHPQLVKADAFRRISRRLSRTRLLDVFLPLYQLWTCRNTFTMCLTSPTTRHVDNPHISTHLALISTKHTKDSFYRQVPTTLLTTDILTRVHYSPYRLWACPNTSPTCLPPLTTRCGENRRVSTTITSIITNTSRTCLIEKSLPPY
jgi:hypothetical protein